MRFEALQQIAIALSQERSLETLLKLIVDELSRCRGIALARVWTVGSAEECEICRAKPHPSDGRCSLHLYASAGRPIHSREDWSRLDGDFHSGGSKVHEINHMAKPILIQDIREDHKWIERPEWARRERIRSFAGHPLIFRGEQLGVTAVFARARLDENEFEWLRVHSIAISVAIVNARAFDEIDQLRQRLKSENAYLREEVSEASGSTTILGTSAAIRRVLEPIEMVAATDATVLILGETGVGKELVARAIHDRSPRRNHPMIRTNCTAIPRELFESEFFGHVKGAFSGAVRDRNGRFQLADGGTLFLDEIGDLPPEIQPKLLRVLQDGEFQPVGDERSHRANVRIIAASNYDLKKAVSEGKFREDLYYRLSVFPIEVPPLRERKEDIPPLASHFLEVACRRFNRSPLQLSPSQIRQLQSYDWPGNVRELQNVIERAVITSRLGVLHFDIHEGTSAPPAMIPASPENPPPEAPAVMTDEEMKRRERENIAAALERSGGRIYGAGGAAELLRMKPTTLSSRIKKLGLTPERG
jgi:transcriptional regulator with GAF, ATPase, and Fis domain